MLGRCNAGMKDAGEEQRVAHPPLLLAVFLHCQDAGAAQGQPLETCGQAREGRLSAIPCSVPFHLP